MMMQNQWNEEEYLSRMIGRISEHTFTSLPLFEVNWADEVTLIK